jgi:hypothetical protein
VLIAATGGALALAADVAYVTIPSDGVIQGCYSMSGGSLRVIDGTVTTCGKNETALAWNVAAQRASRDTGPQGPTGPAGPTGPQARKRGTE